MDVDDGVILLRVAARIKLLVIVIVINTVELCCRQRMDSISFLSCVFGSWVVKFVKD